MGKFINKPGGSTSKRIPSRKRNKIEKKVREHKRKLRKESRKMKALGIFKKKTKKDIGLPNLYPFKAQVLKSLERKKKEKEREAKLKKLKKKEGTSEIDLANAAEKSAKFEEEMAKNAPNEDDEFGNKELGSKERRKYIKELKKVIEAADIILEVLDARDPIGTRCREIEAQILGSPGDKKIILVLNKIDLVPPGNADAWLKHLRREYAAVLFKANTQNQNANLSSTNIFKKSMTAREDLAEELLSSSKAVGADKLLELIKNYSKTDGVKQAVTVGLVGFPNVGKSSVINSLKRMRAASVSSVPGHTKNMQEIQLDSKVKLLDCPGIVFSEDAEKELVLRNIVKVEDVKDPVAPIEDILQKLKKNDLLLLYKIADFNNTTEFLANVAVSRGKLNKGGVADLEKAARLVLHDWNSGKLKYYTLPPGDSTTMQME